MCFLKFIPQASPLGAPTPNAASLTPPSVCLHQPLSKFHQQPAEQKSSPSSTQLTMLSFLHMLALNSQAISALDEVFSSLLRSSAAATPC